MHESSGSSAKGRTPKYCRDLRAFWKATIMIELSTKVILLWEWFQRKSACFWRAFNKSQPAFAELLESFRRACFRKTFVELLRERACVCVSLLTTTNCRFSRNRKKTKFLSRKFANTRSTKALRDSAAVHESQPDFHSASPYRKSSQIRCKKKQISG